MESTALELSKWHVHHLTADVGGCSRSELPLQHHPHTSVVPPCSGRCTALTVPAPSCPVIMKVMQCGAGNVFVVTLHSHSVEHPTAVAMHSTVLDSTLVYVLYSGTSRCSTVHHYTCPCGRTFRSNLPIYMYIYIYIKCFHGACHTNEGLVGNCFRIN